MNDNDFDDDTIITYYEACIPKGSQKLVGNASLSSFIFGLFVVIYITILFIIIRKNYLLTHNTRFNAFFLPIYNYPVIFVMFISFIIGIVNIIGDENYQLKYLLYFYTLKWFVYQICQITLMIFFLYQGIGLNVIKKSFLISILWSLITTIIIISLIGMNFNDEEYDNLDNIIISYIVFISVISIFQIIVWLSPQKSLYRRPAAIFIAQAFLLVNIISFILLVSIFATEENKNSICGLKIYTKLLDFIEPLIFLRSMNLDSMFWQGLYASEEANLNQPLLGIWEMGRQTLTAVSDCVNLFEKKVINIIPFNYLTLDTTSFIAGGASRVYKGNCFEIDRVVAVKILFCMELTPERIVQFCNEATLLNSLNHPNIVTCYGVSLMPPAISLVTEYCHYGSLYNFLHTYDVVRETFKEDSSYHAERVLRISDVSSISFASYKLYDNSSSIGTKEHELSARTLSSQIKDSLLSASYSISSNEMIKRVEDAIDFKDELTNSGKLKNAQDFMSSKEMRYGLGPENKSANRISTNSNIIHDNVRDASVNSFRTTTSKQTLGNFLPLDFKVKLCYECCSGIAYLHSKGFVHNDVKSLNFLVTKDLTVKLSDLGETRISNSKISAEDIPTSVNWSAPELLCGIESVNTAADVWGLALVCIEILTGSVPFDTPEYRTIQLKAFAQKLKEGLRPEIPSEIKESQYKWLSDLIELAWAYDPSKRCTAEYMVKEFQKQLKK